MRWLVPFLASVAVHLVAAIVLFFTFAPVPVPEQGSEKLDVTMGIMRVEERQAEERAPEGSVAEDQSTAGQEVASGVVPRRFVGSTDAEALRLAPKDAETPVASSVEAETSVAAIQPDLAKVSDVDLSSESLSSVSVSQQVVAAASPIAEELAPADGAELLAAATDAMQALASVEDKAEMLAAAQSTARIEAAEIEVTTEVVQPLANAPVVQASQTAKRPDAKVLVAALANRESAESVDGDPSFVAPEALVGSKTEPVSAVAEPVRPSSPEVTEVAIALAWSGDQEISLDPQSLSTLEAFISPDKPRRVR